LEEISAKLETTESQREEFSQKLAFSDSKVKETQEFAKNAESKLKETSAKLKTTESQRDELYEKLAFSDSKLKETQEFAKNAELQLEQIQTELDQSRSQLHDTREELEITQFQLDEVQAELEQSQSQLFENKEELNACKSQLQPPSKMQPTKNGFHGFQKETSQTLCHSYRSGEELKKSMFELQQTQTKLAHNPELIYPSVNLFLYDLRESLGQDLDLKKNRIKFLRQIDSELDKQINQGESWFVWGQLCDDRSNFIQVAQECYQQLNPDSPEKPNFTEVGEFEGAKVFEYWNIPTNWGQKWDDFARESYGLIVCLFPASENPEQIEVNRQKIQKIYFDLARLFCYRHKVILAYWQSRQLKKELKLQSKEIKKLVGEGNNICQQIKEKKPLQLGELQLTLTEILPLVSSYADRLFLLENQAKTVAVNLENYRRRLASMEENSNCNLEGWKEFINFAAEKYQQQIESDCINLSPELKVLENSIATMRGIIDIERAFGRSRLNRDGSGGGNCFNR
ncbi:MAG: hypothetical protein SXA11_19390, partial [Cyanobacteriota bacterium]|nr:hypothetical protein [Cyanobacteriota bacterium]